MSMQRQVLTGKELQKAFWQSDLPVVPVKQSNVCGGKGQEKIRLGVRDTISRHRTGQRLSTKLTLLTQRAKRSRKYKFISIMHLFTEEFLKGCFWELKKGRAPGIDGVSLEEYGNNLEENIKELLSQMRVWKYKSQPVRRVYIPKSDGSKRSLGIPTVEDKVVQMGIKKILDAIFEVDFMDVSYGFRAKVGCHEALDRVDKAIMAKPVNHVVDMDIEKYFDTVNHEWLMKCLKQRITDTNFLRLIGRFLKAGVMEGGKYIEIDKGTPQGGVLSPVLANIYLHYILDLWFEKVAKKQFDGYAEEIRYCDDFVCCFQKKQEAEKFGIMLRERLSKFGLKISEKKSRIVGFGRYAQQNAKAQGKKVETFDFLGFTHYCGKTRRGMFMVGRKTSAKKFSQKMKAINLWLKGIRNMVELKEWWRVLKQKLAGHYIYYGISGNMPCLKKYSYCCTRLAFKWINRRSQKKSYNFEQYIRFMEYNPLPKPKIYHQIYTLSS